MDTWFASLRDVEAFFKLASLRDGEAFFKLASLRDGEAFSSLHLWRWIFGFLVF